MSISPSPPSRRWILAEFAVPVVLGIALTMWFWWPLWQGGEFIGGDTYAYYYPQKSLYADELRAGRIPLWNPLVGNGYPLLAESQTGVLYPPNLWCYSTWDIGTAYSRLQLFHYVLAYLTTWLLARRLKLTSVGASFAAFVFVYSWFPSRICLEWAIIGGAYTPLLIWCVESYLVRPRLIYLWLLTGTLALFLLAGHFNLAFIALMGLGFYVPLRIGLSRAVSISPVDTPANGDRQEADPALPWRTLWPLSIAVIAGFLLAAVQILPSWELTTRSQRTALSKPDLDPAVAAALRTEFDPGYGHIPPWYLSQLVAPWLWYDGNLDLDRALAGTNRVEAHLYCGMIPILLMLGGTFFHRWGKSTQSLSIRILLGIGLFCVVYATGWLVPLFRHVPGFGQFRGPGRYGILFALAVSLAAGEFGGQWLAKRSLGTQFGLGIVAFLVTVADLSHVAKIVTYAEILPTPVLATRHSSGFLQLFGGRNAPGLATSPQSVRVLAPGPNLVSILGINSTPVYLGLGPAEYYDGTVPLVRSLPLPDDPEVGPQERAGRFAQLQQAGVTHLLSEVPLPRTDPVRHLSDLRNGFLNGAWQRYDPLYLYELQGSTGRLGYVAADYETAPTIIGATADCVQIQCAAQRDTQLVLRDLDYPGWEVWIDDHLGTAQRTPEAFRSTVVPAGKHHVEWRYQPRSVRNGSWVSWAMFVLWTVTGALCWTRKLR